MIPKPFPMDNSAKAVSIAYDALPLENQTGDYWQEAAVAPFKTAAKTYYIDAQLKLCCYCRREILTQNQRVWDLEHILPRAVFPRYMFEPQNLAISCTDCNLAKGDKNAANQLKYKNFPKKSVNYQIIHPHFDNFDDHITVIATLLYIPRNGSLKGKKTIELCNLMRFADTFDGKMGRVCDKRYEHDVAALLFADNKDDARIAAKKILTAFEDDDD